MSDDLGELTGEWLSPREFADRVGIAETAARQRAYDREWPRRKGENGRVQILVPFDELRSKVVSQALSLPGDGLAQAGEGFQALIRYLSQRDAERDQASKRQTELIEQQAKKIGNLERQVRELKRRLEAYRVTEEERRLGGVESDG